MTRSWRRAPLCYPFRAQVQSASSAEHLPIPGVDFEDQTVHGISFEPTDGSAGTFNVDLLRLDFRDQGLSVMWVEDQAGRSEAAPDPIGSDGSIDLILRQVAVSGTGFAKGEAQSCRPLTGEDGCPWADVDGLRIDEDAAGSVDVVLRQVSGSGNDGQGLQVTENEGGNMEMTIVGSVFSGNGNTAVEMEEEDGGGHDVTIRGSSLLGEGAEESLDVINRGAGSSTVRIRGSVVTPDPVSTGNVTFDIRP